MTQQRPPIVERLSLAALVIVAGIVRLMAAAWGAGRVPPTADGSFYHVVAQRIAQGEGYTWLWPDGVVTPAAHYPVGYPALLAPFYSVFGPEPAVAMVVNAVMGTAGVVAAVHLSERLLLELERAAPDARRWSLGLGWLLALAPTLVLYTPAMMTESNVGALVVVAFSVGLGVSRPRASTALDGPLRPVLGLVLAAIVLAGATFLRPQSIIMAPLLGWSLGRTVRGRFVRALSLSCLCALMVLPWTLRNCERMERCVFVSANGGWNLLIGTFAEGQGSWVALSGDRVPLMCREVFQEAEKDRCFGEAAVDRIRSEPVEWLALMPSKLRATFDYSAAAAPHLAEAGALGDQQRGTMQTLEYIHQRGLAVLALLGAAWLALLAGRNRRWVLPLGLVAVVGFAGLSAPLGWACVVLLALAAPRRFHPALVLGWGTLVTTAAVYAVFFGAGRYALPVLYAVGPLGALGVGALSQLWGRLFDTARAPEG